MTEKFSHDKETNQSQNQSNCNRNNTFKKLIKLILKYVWMRKEPRIAKAPQWTFNRDHDLLRNCSNYNSVAVAYEN